MRRSELVGWIVVAIVLSALAIPWFLWGEGTVVAGLPLWLWWHIGWMILASIVFWIFTQRAWGIGIESRAAPARAGDRPGNESGGDGP
ncbi:DUF3311 domain-containing protein [Natronobacterium texcoconense]|uniref:DUF3311 domain-containing protein n=1 Tax=Natronobacterium texcoconense TaxID=1095778 RepID=A0A1H1FL43_NATTX|nr:DUF3311 domain-containing protein [Natronobacterium texcoconense]SDR01590.1 Protein of unknown function [Natronobacterium texcoconense]